MSNNPNPEPTPTPAPQPAPAPAPAPAPQPETSVPYARFKEVNDKLKALETAAQQKAANDQTLAERLQKMETDLASERASHQRLEIATKKGLPADLAGRLQGATAEELERDADALLAFMKPAAGPGVPPPSRGGQPAKLDISGKTPAEIRKMLADDPTAFQRMLAGS